MQNIDTSPTSPYNKIEMVNFHQRIKASNSGPILVLAAGTNPMEETDMVRLYKEIDVKRFITTQMDVAQHIGSILAVADSESLAICNVSISANATDRLKNILSISLALLIMPYTNNKTSNQQNTRATQ